MSGLVPNVDLAPFYAGDRGGLRALAAQVDRACREVGFLIVGGHRVPHAMLDEAFTQAAAFFALPLADKQRVAPADKRVRGYTPLGAQALAYSQGTETPPDLFERFRIGPFDFPQDDYHAARAQTYFAPNLWPPAPPGFRPALCAYYAAMAGLAHDLMAIFALALDLPRDFFHDKIDRHVSSLCLNHYPPQREAPLPGQLRTGPHTDYGSLTIVAPTPGPGGLEVHGRDGRWHPVNPAHGTFAVNIGDLMAQWTNDRWVSTLHRVANPQREVAAASPRLSLIFFHQPNDDALVECLPGCQSADRPAAYAPVTSGAHLTAKINRAFAMRRSADRSA